MAKRTPTTTPLTKKSPQADKKNAPKKTTRKTSTQQQTPQDEETYRLVDCIIKAIDNVKGEHITQINMTALTERISDYFIIADATTSIQLNGIADNIEREVKTTLKISPYKRDKTPDSQWIVLDYVTVMVHLFLPEQRQFYNLEECWSEGKTIGVVGGGNFVKRQTIHIFNS